MAAGRKEEQRRKVNKENRHRHVKALMGAVAVFVLIFAGFFMFNQIKDIKIEGNEYYSDEEIKELIINGALEENAWYLYWKYKYGKTPDIPFVDTVEVEVTGMGKVKITVYEKGITGYVEYLDHYMYFDKDGVVVESSKKQVEGVPLICGLEFQNIVLYEPLSIKNPEVFTSILNLTQLMKKNHVNPDKINCSENDELILYFNDAKVLLGSDAYLEEKIVRLSSLVQEIQNRSGILHMENFQEDTKNITFENTA